MAKKTKSKEHVEGEPEVKKTKRPVDPNSARGITSTFNRADAAYTKRLAHVNTLRAKLAKEEKELAVLAAVLQAAAAKAAERLSSRLDAGKTTPPV
jgi:hypothetical protein